MRVHYRWMPLALALTLSLLALAGAREAQAQIPNANHYKCYELINKPLVAVPVNLVDQFGVQNGQTVLLRYLCNPVSKNGSATPNPNLHYACYDLNVPPIPVKTVKVTNQFHTAGITVQVQQAKLLCLPSTKMLINP